MKYKFKLAILIMLVIMLFLSVLSYAGNYTVTVNDAVLDQAIADTLVVDSRPATRAQYVQRLITEWQLTQRQLQHNKQKEVVEREEVTCVESGKRFIISKVNERLSAVCEN